MAKHDNFTADRVAYFKCQPGKMQSIYWDGKTPGLGVRVTAAGAKSYIFETSLHGKTIRLTIGDVRTWTVAKAQAEATTLKGMTDKGIDPRLEIARQRAAQDAQRDAQRLAQTTGLEAWATYLQERQVRWGTRTYQDHLRAVDEGGKKKTRGKRAGEGDVTQPGILRALLLRPLMEIDAVVVGAWVKTEVEKRPTRAALAFRLLRGFLNWCAAHPEFKEIVQADACSGRSARDQLPRKSAREDCLQREQLPLWFEHVQKLVSPIQSTYLQGLLITGARREELSGLRWEEVDFRWNSLTIRDKVEGERTIPLTPYLASLLLKLKAANDTPPPRYRILNGKKIENDLENWRPSPWVFSSKTAASGRLQEPRIGHNRALASAGLPPLTLHGLRRSFATLAEWVECPVGVVAQIMGHKPSAIAEKHYRRRPLDLLRMWHTKIEAWILEQAYVPFSEEGRVTAVRSA